MDSHVLVLLSSSSWISDGVSYKYFLSTWGNISFDTCFSEILSSRITFLHFSFVFIEHCRRLECFYDLLFAVAAGGSYVLLCSSSDLGRYVSLLLPSSFSSSLTTYAIILTGYISGAVCAQPFLLRLLANVFSIRAIVIVHHFLSILSLFWAIRACALWL